MCLCIGMGGGGGGGRQTLYLDRSSLTNEKDHHYFLNRFVCVGGFFDG